MDDKLNSETHANNETAADPPPGALVVNATGSSDASKFTGCYFVISGSGPDATWTLYNRGGVSLANGQEGASGFNFDHDTKKGAPSQKIVWTTSGCNWTLDNGGDVTEIRGSWNNTDDDDPTAGPQSGSFTAASGGAVDAVSASASA